MNPTNNNENNNSNKGNENFTTNNSMLPPAMDVKIGIEPMLLIAVIALIIIYYFVFASLGKNEDGTASSLNVFAENTLWILFVVLLLLNGISYIFGIDIIKTLKKLFGVLPSKPDADLTEAEKQNILQLKEQVFHLPENKYTFENAKAICNAYGARLAKYEEMDEAYNKGAEWCSYGWSEGQMAFFPTQTESWNKLQQVKGHENDCGRPGINGGHFDNANLLFGVNCFGPKPHITTAEAERMRNTPLYRKNQKEITFDNKVDYWRNRLSELVIAPFNHNNWSVL
jgi:hypothetical protein